MLPGWVEIMNDLRPQRLEADVYKPRRNSLVSAYNRYVRQPSPDAPTSALLPHVVDVARFPPFRDIIEAPEEISVNDKSFASAFAQLPVLVSEWKEELDTELAQMVNIPRHLRSKNASTGNCRDRIPRGTTQSSDADMDRLHLACALFRTASPGAFNHLEVFSRSMLHRYTNDREDVSERSGSITERFDVRFLEEAPDIVHACGLDPSVATVDDMDHRNARLKCLSCEGRNLITNWRDAVRFFFY